MLGVLWVMKGQCQVSLQLDVCSFLPGELQRQMFLDKVSTFQLYICVQQAVFKTMLGRQAGFVVNQLIAKSEEAEISLKKCFMRKPCCCCSTARSDKVKVFLSVSLSQIRRNLHKCIALR